MINVTHYLRKFSPGAYSLERLFADIRAYMPADIKIRSRESSFASRGLWRRIYNMLEAIFRQGEVNHITGDVHFLAILLFRRRTVLTILDCVLFQSLSGIHRSLLWLFWYALPVRRAQVITVVSEATKVELLKFVNCDPPKIVVIYASVSEFFRPANHLFNSTCPRVLQIGTTLHNKNIERVAEALATINCRWVIIGRLAAVQLAAIERFGIDFENYIDISEDALLVQYKLADMLVFASTYEGFGLPIVEANAVGRPVVTSNLCSMPEVAGAAACLVDPYNVASIRAGILRVIQDTGYRNLLVHAGFENVKRFRPATIAAQYAELYRRVHSAKQS